MKALALFLAVGLIMAITATSAHAGDRSSVPVRTADGRVIMVSGGHHHGHGHHAPQHRSSSSSGVSVGVSFGHTVTTSTGGGHYGHQPVYAAPGRQLVRMVPTHCGPTVPVVVSRCAPVAVVRHAGPSRVSTTSWGVNVGFGHERTTRR